MSSNADGFEPTTTFLAGSLVDGNAASSPLEANRLVLQAAREAHVSEQFDSLDDFIEVCDVLKLRGGLIEFVATRAATAAVIRQTTAILNSVRGSGDGGRSPSGW